MKTKSIVDKNFALSAGFTRYVIKNPEFADDLPRKSYIVFSDKSDISLTRANLKLARETKKRGEKYFKIIKDKRSWSIEPLAV